MKVDPWPRLDRFKEHTLELPVGDLVVERRQRRRAARPARQGARHRQGRDAPARAARPACTARCSPARRRRTGRRGQGVLDQARLPDLRHQLPRARPAHVQLQQQARLVHDLRRHRPASSRASSARPTTTRSATTTTSGREQSFPAEEAGGRRRASTSPARTAPARASIRLSRGVTFDGESIAWIAQWSVSDARKWVESLALDGPRRRDRARRRHRDPEPPRVPRGSRPRLPDARPRRADAFRAARRSASASPRSSARNLQGVCYVLDEPTIGLHSARQRRSCSTRCTKLGDKGNTLVVVEHDEDTIRRADHIIDIGPGAGKRGGTAGRARAASSELSSQRRFGDRPLPRSSAGAPAAAAAHGRDGDGGDRAQGGATNRC